VPSDTRPASAASKASTLDTLAGVRAFAKRPGNTSDTARGIWIDPSWRSRIRAERTTFAAHRAGTARPRAQDGVPLDHVSGFSASNRGGSVGGHLARTRRRALFSAAATVRHRANGVADAPAKLRGTPTTVAAARIRRSAQPPIQLGIFPPLAFTSHPCLCRGAPTRRRCSRRKRVTGSNPMPEAGSSRAMASPAAREALSSPQRLRVAASCPSRQSASTTQPRLPARRCSASRGLDLLLLGLRREW